MKILYAEDDPVTRMMLHKALSKNFNHIETAQNGAEAWEKYQNNQPNLLITDLSMPELNGFELIDHIRQRKPDFPVIVTTAYREEAQSILKDHPDADSERRGTIAVFYKPVKMKDIIDHIHYLAKK